MVAHNSQVCHPTITHLHHCPSPNSTISHTWTEHGSILQVNSNYRYGQVTATLYSKTIVTCASLSSGTIILGILAFVYSVPSFFVSMLFHFQFLLSRLPSTAIGTCLLHVHELLCFPIFSLRTLLILLLSILAFLICVTVLI
jgi:hypothetical protein